MKILAVDDEPIFLDLLLQTLTPLGYTSVITASSGQAALDLIASEARPFDCFLLDIRMEGMNGIELCRRIRALPAHRLTPIVMVTALSEKRYVDEAFMAGANDYVTKPIDRVEIKVRLSMVRTILGERLHAGLLNRQIVKAEESLGADCQFKDPLVLLDAHGLTPFETLENYLLKLGNMRLTGSSAIGFHIENGERIFEKTSGIEFIDVLTDVASVLADVLKTHAHMLAYAGNGDFVAVIQKAAEIVPDALQAAIQDGLAGFADIHLESGIAPPQIRVGEPRSNGMLSFGEPTRMLDEAIAAARLTVTPDSPRKRRRALSWSAS
jgi:CheY-like chemotaxis protein